MKGIVEINETTSESRIDFKWDPLVTHTETGGTPILSYNVQWDRGFSGIIFFDLAGYSSDFMLTTYSATAKITKGRVYYVRVRAKNYWGWGPFSTVMQIKASTAPDKMSGVKTYIDQLTGGIRVEWNKPYENSDTITAYKIEGLRLDNTWITVCSDSSIVALLKCVVPMSILHDDFSLAFKHIA